MRFESAHLATEIGSVLWREARPLGKAHSLVVGKRTAYIFINQLFNLSVHTLGAGVCYALAYIKTHFSEKPNPFVEKNLATALIFG